MRVLWLTNGLPRFLGDKLGLTTTNNLSWIDYSAKMILNMGASSLCFVFPYPSNLSGEIDGISYVSFPGCYTTCRDDEGLKRIFRFILNHQKVDIIHIYGTEFYQAVAMMKACTESNITERAIISIQGLVGVYAQHYNSGLDNSTIRNYTLRDVLKRENLRKAANKFAERGTAETEALKLAKNVIGRTAWDYACTKQINPELHYYHCNETLREPFYSGQWKYEACDPYTIFVSQLSYPIKGFHQLLKAMPIVLQRFPDVRIYVTGPSVFDCKWYRENSYYQYIKHEIVRLNLKEKITFLGSLNDEQMKAQYLKSNVFVMPSTIENSPNSLGEAMILGVPCVCADVGGVSSVFTGKMDGFLYPFDEPYLMAHYICEIFSNTAQAERFSGSSRSHASITHAPKKNAVRLLEIYTSMIAPINQKTGSRNEQT